MLGLLKKLRDKGLWNFLNTASGRMHLLKTQYLYRPFFGRIGKRSVIRNPVFITTPAHICIGDEVMIRDSARLEMIVRDNGAPPRLVIGNRVTVEQDFHLVCSGNITIEDDVAFAARCTVVDTSHPFNDPSKPGNVGRYINEEPAQVRIGQRAFIGLGVTILPNVDIGEGAVIGAHSLVTTNIPAYAIAAGIPARVIRYIK